MIRIDFFALLLALCCVRATRAEDKPKAVSPEEAIAATRASAPKRPEPPVLPTPPKMPAMPGHADVSLQPGAEVEAPGPEGVARPIMIAPAGAGGGGSAKGKKTGSTNRIGSILKLFRSGKIDEDKARKALRPLVAAGVGPKFEDREAEIDRRIDRLVEQNQPK